MPPDPSRRPDASRCIPDVFQMCQMPPRCLPNVSQMCPRHPQMLPDQMPPSQSRCQPCDLSEIDSTNSYFQQGHLWSLALVSRFPVPMGPGSIWAWFPFRSGDRVHLGLGPFGPAPFWAWDHLGLGPYGPGPIWAWAHTGLHPFASQMALATFVIISMLTPV